MGYRRETEKLVLRPELQCQAPEKLNKKGEQQNTKVRHVTILSYYFKEPLVTSVRTGAVDKAIIAISLIAIFCVM